MALVFKKGDLFSESAQALVNTVNCVGVMGKGVALEFKRRWPKNYKAYKRLCDAKKLQPGELFVFENSELFENAEPRFIVNFPTKGHWRAKSKIEYIDYGLDALVDAVRKYNIASVAMPPLGCGNGGLDWAEVRSLIERKLSAVEGVEFVVLAPKEASDQPEHEVQGLRMTFERAILLKALGDLEPHFDGSFDRISLQKIGYLLQALGVNYQLRFSRNLYGPYSESLKRAFLAMERHGLLSGFTGNDKRASVTRGAYALADEYLRERDLGRAETVVGKLDKLIQGYESPYGLELLSSVHWLAHSENISSAEGAISAMTSWSEQKRNKFTPTTIKCAYERLESDGLLP